MIAACRHWKGFGCACCQIKQQHTCLGKFIDHDYDALLEQARASLDPQERLDAYAEVQAILAQDVASVPLYNSLETAVVNSAVDGYVAHPIQYILDLYPVTVNR